jgi:hypothetical protein
MQRILSGLLSLSVIVSACGLSACGPADELSDVESRGAALVVCDSRAFVPPPKTGFRHFGSSLVAALGSPGHSAQDVLSVPSGGAAVEGKFAYGALSKDLEDEQIELYLDDCTGWQRLGSALTNSDGRARFSLRAPLGAGVYGLRLVVRGDATTTAARLFVSAATTPLVVFDIDGTLTTDDEELFKDLLADLFSPILRGDYVPRAYPYSKELVAERTRLGALPVFLTGRPYWLTQRTRDWLSGLGFSRGVLHTTDSNSEVLPTNSSVGSYKLSYLRRLQGQGYTLQAAYGNATTDISAYAGAGIPATSTWIIGKHAGEGGTNRATGTWQPEVERLRMLP